MTKIPELYENRLLLFLEDIDTGVFRQVILDEKQFKKVSDAIGEVVNDGEEYKEGFHSFEVNLDDEREIPADTFIGMTSIHDEKV